MRKMLLGSAMLAMTLGCAGAWAQDASQDMTGARAGHVPGVGDSQPSSTRASNIGSSDTRSEIAPSLPAPMVGEHGTPMEYLRAARHALDGHRTGVAQEALERAETRLLDRVSQNGIAPSQSPAISSLNEARTDLANGDVNGARRAIDQTIQSAQDMRMPGQMQQGQVQQGQMQQGQPGFGAGNNGMNGMSPNSPYPSAPGLNAPGQGIPANNAQSPMPMSGQ